MIMNFRIKQLNLKKLKMVISVFFDIFQLPHTVISNSEKLTYPNLHVKSKEYLFKEENCVPDSAESS